ncbi:MAG: hypothetical protein ABSA57_11185 [Candidatus Acidiferrales bacterium]|jgi:hypothetical protein
MKQFLLAAIALCISPGVLAQTTAPKPRAASSSRDQLGMTCIQILALSSADWVSQFGENAKDAASTEQKKLRAIAAYGKCYDTRTDRLAASLARSAAGAPMGALGSLHDLQQALDTFTLKALAATEPPADALKTAYAQLYEKQFRYGFYQTYEKHSKSSDPGAKGAIPAASPKAASADPAPSTAPAPGSTPPGDTDPVTLAKNHFGELLDALPEDTEHPLHAAFGDIVGRSQMSASTRLAIYRYAIFLLEPPSATPFSPPPF